MLSNQQLEILKSDYILVTWLFKITDQNGVDFYFSNKSTSKETTPFNVGSFNVDSFYPKQEREYENNILNFKGISLRRNSTEMGMQIPDDLEFEINNADDVLTVSHSTFTVDSFTVDSFYPSFTEPEGSRFASGDVELTLELNEITFYIWKFKITRADFSYEKTIQIRCKDFIQTIIDKSYPERLVSDLFGVNTARGDENSAVPVVLGKGYIPLCPVYFSDLEVLYLLGPAEYTYEIFKARSPRAYGPKIEFSNFGQTTKTASDGKNYKFVYATVDPGGVEADNVLWENGDRLQNMPFQFSRSDTVNFTNPADWIDFVLKDMGVSSSDIDSFDSAKNTFSDRGIEWNGGYDQKRPIKEILTELQSQCHAQLISREKISLDVLSNEVVGYINKSVVYRQGGEAFGGDTFRAKSIEYKEDATCGYIALQESEEPIDTLIKELVPCESESENPSGSILSLPFIDSSVIGQKIGALHFQLLLEKTSDISYQGQPENIAFLPNSVLIIAEKDYGGSYKITVDQIRISETIDVSMQCIRFASELKGWD